MDPSLLHVLVIDENRFRGFIVEEGLMEADSYRVTPVRDNDHLMQRIVATDPGSIEIDLVSPDWDALKDMFQISRAMRRPIARFMDRSAQGEIEAAIAAGVSAHLVDGLVVSSQMTARHWYAVRSTASAWASQGAASRYRPT